MNELKRDLLDRLAFLEMQAFNEDGTPGVYSPFEIDSDRAKSITRDVFENVYEHLSEHRDGGVSPIEMIKIAARNLDLYDENEKLHFVYICGVAHEKISKQQEDLKETLKLFGAFKEHMRSEMVKHGVDPDSFTEEDIEALKDKLKRENPFDDNGFSKN